MPRPVTLFTGQWADLSLSELLPLVKKMGYDGVELACWGDHFEVDRALAEPDYVKKKWALLQKNGLTCFAISSHLVGQAICDLIDDRHKAILPADVWGDGKPEGVRQRAAEKMKATARAARKFFDAKPGAKKGQLPGRRQRLHRLVHLARALRIPADEPGFPEQRLLRFRQALDADPRRV